MSLQVKRAIKQVEEQVAPQLSRINEITGKDISVNIDYKSFTSEDSVKWLPNGFFDRFVEDLEKVCSDDFGKEAVQEALNTVVVVEADAKELTFDSEAKTLTVKGKWAGSPGSDYPTYSDYKNCLEANL